MSPVEEDRSLSELDEGFSEADRTAADVEQTLSDADQTRSERDQRSAEHDQAAANSDQEFSDDTDHRDDASAAAHFEETRRIRATSRLERAATGLAREQTTEARDQVARRRDQVAAARDLASAARDSLAAALDAEIDRLEREQLEDPDVEPRGGHARLRAARARRLAARARAQAAAQRRAAAEDRAHAAEDRELAALDRLAYAKELASAEVDEVTGALRRRIGLAALQREMDRTERVGEALTIVFIDVDGLKHVNDELGHSAGDALLRTVVRCVMDEFRSYDLIFRFGGDEFLCSLSGDGLQGVAARFERIAARIGMAVPDATISIGVEARRPKDTVETLIERADNAMIAGRRSPNGVSQRR